MTYPNVTPEALAEALWSVLKEDDDALIVGSVEGRCTLIDGNFDLLSVAEAVLARLSERPG